MKKIETVNFDNEIIELAWKDNIDFNFIKKSFGLKEKDVIKIMRKNLKKSSFNMWRKRVKGRITKHRKFYNI